MYKLLRIAALVLPLGGGVALAQGSGTNGSANATHRVPMGTNNGTTDTRTPTQKQAGSIDDTASPAVPGDATKARGLPETAPMSDRAGMPDSADKSQASPSVDEAAKGARPPKGDLQQDQAPSDK